MDDPYRISVSEVFSEKFNNKKSGNMLKFHAIMPINLQHSVHATSFIAQCRVSVVVNHTMYLRNLEAKAE